MNNTEKYIPLLAEECSEIIHISMKSLRFGMDSFHHCDPNKTSNLTLLEQEYNDLLAVADLIGLRRNEDYIENKKNVIQQLQEY